MGLQNRGLEGIGVKMPIRTSRSLPQQFACHSRSKRASVIAILCSPSAAGPVIELAVLWHRKMARLASDLLSETVSMAPGAAFHLCFERTGAAAGSVAVRMSFTFEIYT